MTIASRVILLDMDGVLVDIEAGFLTEYRRRHPDRPYVERHDRCEFWIQHEYSRRFGEEYDRLTNVIFTTPGFFRSLPVMPRAQAAVAEMLATGVPLFICTAPVTDNLACATEKMEWLVEHFGKEVSRRTVVAKDKTLVRGAVLVDDNPHVDGALRPEWEQVLFDAPYNLHVTGKRRMSWTTDWRDTLRLR